MINKDSEIAYDFSGVIAKVRQNLLQLLEDSGGALDVHEATRRLAERCRPPRPDKPHKPKRLGPGFVAYVAHHTPGVCLDRDKLRRASGAPSVPGPAPNG